MAAVMSTRMMTATMATTMTAPMTATSREGICGRRAGEDNNHDTDEQGLLHRGHRSSYSYTSIRGMFACAMSLSVRRNRDADGGAAHCLAIRNVRAV